MRKGIFHVTFQVKYSLTHSVPLIFLKISSSKEGNASASYPGHLLILTVVNN